MPKIDSKGIRGTAASIGNVAMHGVIGGSGEQRTNGWKMRSLAVKLNLAVNGRGENAMPISVSPEAEAKARQIPDFSARLERFINDQFDLEQWRRRRTKSEVLAVVEEGLCEGADLRVAETDRATLFARLRSLNERLSHGQ
jgi:hypothetical protein